MKERARRGDSASAGGSASTEASGGDGNA
jgi:hypothetical protein